jgi:DNA-binding response OmpR family regulator
MPASSKKRILVVEDDRAIARMLEKIRGIQVGARHYLTKPFKLEEVRDKVAKALK